MPLKWEHLQVIAVRHLSNVPVTSLAEVTECVYCGEFFFFWPSQSARIDCAFPFVSPKSKWNKMPWVKIKSLWHTARSLLCSVRTRRQCRSLFRSNMCSWGTFPFFPSFFLSTVYSLKAVEQAIFFLIRRFNNHDGLNKYLLCVALTWTCSCAWGSSKLKPPQMARCLETQEGRYYY